MNSTVLFLGCGKTINLSNGGSEEITMTSYSSGKLCTWLVKVRKCDVMFYLKKGFIYSP